MVIIWWFWSLLAICASDSFRDQAVAIMRTTPVIDGHNDLPWQLLNLFNNQLLRPDADLNKLAQTHTNIPKLKAGFVGGQFWSAYMPCDTQNKDAVKRILEQMDVIHRMCQLYPETFMCVTNSSDILQAFRRGKVASLIGVEGGHLIDSSLGVLRTLYHLGMRYLTLTHNCNTPWADNWLVDRGDDEAESQGLSPFGKRLLNEMNRLGVMIDLSHVSVATMKDALQISRAPVIFSHSSAYSLCPHRRNVPDDVLQLVKNTSSLVMVNFFSNFVSCSDSATLPQVAEEEKSTTTLVTKSKEKVMEKEAKQSDKESQPAESLLFATSKHSRPSSSSEGREIQRRPAAARQQGWDLFLRMMTREMGQRWRPPPPCLASASRTLCSIVSLSTSGMSSFTVPRDLEGCSLTGTQTMLTLKRCGALLAIGKEAFLR